VTGRKTKGKSASEPGIGLSETERAYRAEFGERMRTLLDLYESRPDAAAVAGVTPEHLASYISGKAKPPFQLVARLAAEKRVSLQWMASGEGNQDLAEAVDGYVSVPVAEAESSSGAGTYPMAEDVRDYMVFSRAWLRAVVRAPEDRLLIVYNRGDGNAPGINDGDAMLLVTGIDRVSEDGAYYVFRPEGSGMITRRVRIFLDGSVSLQTARNEESATRENADKWVYGRVRWRGGIV